MFKAGSNSGVDGRNGDRINNDFHGGGGIYLHGSADDGVHGCT
jgi:hypothetical protein